MDSGPGGEFAQALVKGAGIIIIIGLLVYFLMPEVKNYLGKSRIQKLAPPSEAVDVP